MTVLTNGMSKENGFGFAKVKVDSLIYGTTKIPKQKSILVVGWHIYFVAIILGRRTCWAGFHHFLFAFSQHVV